MRVRWGLGVDFIKIFHYIYKVQRDWGDPRKLSANNPECIHHSDIDVKYHDFNIKSQSFCRVHK